MRTLILFFKLSRPLFLLGAGLLYALGAGIANYLGYSIDMGLYLLGQVWVSLVQLSTHYLNEYFDALADVDNRNRTVFNGGSGVLGTDGLPRQVALYAAWTTLALAAALSVPLLQAVMFSPGVILVMVLGVVGAVCYSTPPVRLSSSGYGELTTSILVANLVPALAFLIQTGEFHRLLLMSTLPLMFLHFGMMLAFELPDYANDLRFAKTTLMVRLGWEAGMRLHNLAVISGFVILGLALVFGMPGSVGLPGMLALPLGGFQIWQMQSIANGSKPNWTLLNLGAVGLFGLCAYLLTYSYWIR